MMLSSAIAGTYAPPAVHEPITIAICGAMGHGKRKNKERGAREAKQGRKRVSGAQRPVRKGISGTNDT